MDFPVDYSQTIAYSRNMKLTNPTAADMGRKGGKASGPRKARSSEQARKAIQLRWSRAPLQERTRAPLQEGDRKPGNKETQDAG